MDRLYDLLASAGYPPAAIDWLRRNRLSAIIVLAILAWIPFLAIAWITWSALAWALS
jgi:hypothetical protein